MPKHVYAARLLSDKMLVYANSLREEVEELITPLLQSAAAGMRAEGETPADTDDGRSHSFHFCDGNSPSSDWPLYPGGIQQDSIFSFVLKNDTHQTSAMQGAFRHRQGFSLKASLYEKKGLSAPLASSLGQGESGGYGDDLPPAKDDKNVRGRRRWSVGLGEKETIENVGGTPVAGTPAVFTGESIPVQSAIQWGKWLDVRMPHE